MHSYWVQNSKIQKQARTELKSMHDVYPSHRSRVHALLFRVMCRVPTCTSHMLKLRCAEVQECYHTVTGALLTKAPENQPDSLKQFIKRAAYICKPVL